MINKIILIAALILVSSMPRIFANQIIPGEQIQAMATDEIEKILSERGETRRHEIVFMSSLNKVSLPNGVIDIKIMLPTAGLSYANVTPMRARISINGKNYRDITFGAMVKIFDKVLVANHDLRIEVAVNKSDFRTEEIVIDGRTQYIKDVQEVVGLVPHRYIRAGQPIAINYFQQPVAVEMGSPVRIIVRRNGLQASAKGIAMSRGRIGQVIKVKNESSQKIVSAKVVDDQTVEVVF